jgi:hypothetical protein
MNRFFRRMKRFGKRGSDQGPASPTGRQQQGTVDPGTPQDVTSTRAKAQRHGKVTADKWNQ